MATATVRSAPITNGDSIAYAKAGANSEHIDGGISYEVETMYKHGGAVGTDPAAPTVPQASEYGQATSSGTISNRNNRNASAEKEDQSEGSNSGSEDFKDAKSTLQQETISPDAVTPDPVNNKPRVESNEAKSKKTSTKTESNTSKTPSTNAGPTAHPTSKQEPIPTAEHTDQRVEIKEHTLVNKALHGMSAKPQESSEWSHQRGSDGDEAKTLEEGRDEWQTMPAFAPYEIYDDDNKLIAREAQESDDDGDAYAGLGGAGKGYTRIQLDEDALSATSLDENTQYLFKDINGGTGAGEMEDEEQRDAVSQMQATKDLLTEGQRIAYVGMTRLITSNMVTQLKYMPSTDKSRKEIALASESLKMWSQKMMVRLYAHMEVNTDEQIMIEQLAEHGVMPADLSPTLMHNARIKNPMAEKTASMTTGTSPKSESVLPSSPQPSDASPGTEEKPIPVAEGIAAPPPPYGQHKDEGLPEVRTPSQLPATSKLDIDLRWTVLCDLFLTLVADSVYDARSRVLLEKVAQNMDISWVEICRFEKRVTDALEMQQEAEKENWNEDDHKEARRKLALKKRYIIMGLATVGGGLVIGFSAGLLAPVIGAGLAAGFSTVGIAGTSGFLAGAGGAAIITTGAAASGGAIAVRAANRRTGAVKTFEYRPLHNNKRVNLIVTVSGWMTGKVDDVRLPYSTIDPVMGDIYSVLWEPEMLRSMGDTINILATEALTQGLQQVLGSTILIGLMAALQLPIVLTKLTYLIDNPWTNSLERANAAGLILADSLIDRNLGTRPIIFVGYSLGCRMIFSCLQELAKKGAFGMVQDVYLFGSPIVAKRDEYLKVRSVVAGRFVNGYANNDWILGYLFRMTSGGISRVAGLAPVEDIPGLENVNVTELVPGHMSYRTAMPRLLREVGWLVESDEFTEIEDPDPENHSQRHRELINEIEEARKEYEKKEKERESKGKFGFFSRKKKAAIEKQEWEMYQEPKGDPDARVRTEDSGGNERGVLFDVDAIRAELASQQMDVKELKSTLPPMTLILDQATDPPASRSTRSIVRETQSHSPKHTIRPCEPRPASASLGLINGTAASGIDPYPYPQEDSEIQLSFDMPSSQRHYTNAVTQKSFNTSSPPPTSFSERPLPIRSDSPIPAAFTHPRNTTPPVSTGAHMASLPVTEPLPDMALLHNAWADDADGYGQEKEMEMTFA